MLRKFYLVTSAALILSYGAAALQGWEIGSPQRAFVPADVRNSPGGYRSFHFWHFGYHGGK